MVVSESSAVPIIDTSRIDDSEFFKVFVGIHFGMDGTAWGWSKLNKVFIHQNVVVNRKDKTNILLDSDYNAIAFGIEATNLYINLPKKYKNCYYFERFSMSLHDQEMLHNIHDKKVGSYDDFEDEIKHSETRRESYLLPANKSLGRVKTQIVFTAAFKYLHNEIMETLDDKGISVDEDEIQWIVALPAIWSQFAKNLMRKAVDEAGMTIPGVNKHLVLALEPECLSVIVREKTGLKKTGTKYILFDLGCATADIASHQILSETAIKQLIPPSGGRWGSKYIDKAFIELIGLLFVYGKSKTNPLIEFAKNFPIALIDLKQYFRQARQSFKGTESIIRIKMPNKLLNFLLSKHLDSNDDDDDVYEDLNEIIDENSVNIKELCEIKMNLKAGDIAIKDCKLALKPYVMEQLFATVLTPTIKHVDNEVLTRPQLSGCKTIFLAGGLTSSSFVKAVITKHYGSSMAIYSIDKPFAAVVEGAVRFGLSY